LGEGGLESASRCPEDGRRILCGLSKRAALGELSLDLEKEMAPGRTGQLKAMETEVEEPRVASRRGDMAGLLRGYKALKNQLNAYFTENGEKVSSDPLGTWRRDAMELTHQIIGEFLHEIDGRRKEDPLAPLRKAMGEVADLKQ
jgi:hypothetical protein